MGLRTSGFSVLLVAWISSTVLAAPAVDLRLVEAVRTGDNAAVRSLLQEPADVNAAEPDGATALAWAVYRDDGETTHLLIGAGADPNAANDYGVTPLSLACTNRNSGLVQKLLEAGANPNAAQWTGETVLMTCASTGSLGGVQSLLEHGADVDASENHEGQTALMWAAAEKRPEIVRLLIQHGANIQARSKTIQLSEPFIIETTGPLGFNYPKTVHFPKTRGGFSAFLFAAQQGDIETARALLEAGADINESTQEDGSALVLATASGHEKLALFLLQKGADPNVKDAYGLTALHYSLGEGLWSLAGFAPSRTDRFGWERFNMPELVSMLLARGADVNAPIEKNFPTLDHPFLARATEDPPQVDPVGATPFLLAAASGDTVAMRALVERGADPNAETLGGGTALLITAGMGFERGRGNENRALEALNLIVEMGGDVHKPLEDGRTALHGAAFLGWNKVIEFLAQKGANLDVKDQYGQTPLSIALGDPEGRVFRNLEGGRADDRFRSPRANKQTAELLVQLGAAPLTGKVLDRSGF